MRTRQGSVTIYVVGMMLLLSVLMAGGVAINNTVSSSSMQQDALVARSAAEAGTRWAICEIRKANSSGQNFAVPASISTDASNPTRVHLRRDDEKLFFDVSSRIYQDNSATGGPVLFQITVVGHEGNRQSTLVSTYQGAVGGVTLVPESGEPQITIPRHWNGLIDKWQIHPGDTSTDPDLYSVKAWGTIIKKKLFIKPDRTDMIMSTTVKYDDANRIIPASGYGIYYHTSIERDLLGFYKPTGYVFQYDPGINGKDPVTGQKTQGSFLVKKEYDGIEGNSYGPFNLFKPETWYDPQDAFQSDAGVTMPDGKPQVTKMAMPNDGDYLYDVDKQKKRDDLPPFYLAARHDITIEVHTVSGQQIHTVSIDGVPVLKFIDQGPQEHIFTKGCEGYRVWGADVTFTAPTFSIERPGDNTERIYWGQPNVNICRTKE